MAGRVDLESLLWEAREVLRDLSKVSRAQSAEIERLGGCPWEGAHELQERADGVVAGVAIALDQLQADPNGQLFAAAGAANADEDGSSEASSSYAARAAAIDEWAAQTERLRGQFETPDTAFPVGLDLAPTHQESHITFDFDHNDNAAEGAADVSFASATSGFWETDNFNWADEPSSDEDDEGHGFNASRSLLNIPDLLDSSARFDSASDSGESFASEDMLAHSGMKSGAAETVCSERMSQEPTMSMPVAQDVMNHRFIRNRTVSFNIKMTEELVEEVTSEEDPTIKASSSGYQNRVSYHHSAPHLRRLGHKGSLPNIKRLVTLRE